MNALSTEDCYKTVSQEKRNQRRCFQQMLKTQQLDVKRDMTKSKRNTRKRDVLEEVPGELLVVVMAVHLLE